MDALLSNRNDTHNSLHSIRTESSRPPESTTSGAVGMEYQSRDIQHDQQQLGSTQHRPIRFQHKRQTTAIHVMATRSKGRGSRCSPSTLDTPRSPVHLSAMELDPQSTPEAETGEDRGHHHCTQLVRSNLGTHHPEHGNSSPHPPSTLSSPRSKGKRVRSPIEEPDLVSNGLERKRRRLAAEGYNTTVIDIMTRSETELRKQSRYNYVQEKYHEWCHDNKLDPYIANPSN
ncbi:hypothetical protein BGZ89_007700, partial [Linnemannia elongata]